MEKKQVEFYTMKAQLENKVRALARVITYPVRADGLLIDSPRIGQLTELKEDRVTVELSGCAPTGRFTLVVGVTLPDESLAYFGVVIERDSLCGELRNVEAIRGGIAEQILADDGRIPVLRESNYRFALAFSDEVYKSWQEVGILSRRVLDKVLVCPKCASLPTFRFGCQQCGSGSILRSIMVHHFACACVAPLKQFEGEVSLQCPKCQTKHLIAGTDFEYAPGTHHCQTCGWKSHELEQTGHCLRCETRFPFHQAVEQEMVGYDADRLDALALVAHLG